MPDPEIQYDSESSKKVACQYENKSPFINGKSDKFFREPRYVNACENAEWSLFIWSKTDPEKRFLKPFKCHSWRHSGECCRWKGAQDFVRVNEAIASRRGWVYIVLTFDSSRWKDEWMAYKSGVRLWDKLRKRMIRRWGKIKYIQTWERHQSGWPHVNILVHCPLLFADCDGNGWKKVRKWLELNAIQCGFGMRTWIEPMKEGKQMAGYMTKLSRELIGAGTKNQIPVNAPAHFRRIRASVKLLPKVFKSENSDFTGMLTCSPKSEIDREKTMKLYKLQEKKPKLMQEKVLT